MRILPLLFCCAALCAQTPNGQITGRIPDSAGAAIPGASIFATHVDTGVKTSAIGAADGVYQVPNLIPGKYRLEADAPGFKHYVREGVEMRVGDVPGIGIAMQMGAVNESITVTAAMPLLESETGSLGKVVDNQRILDLPSPGGSVFYLAQLAPGVANTGSPLHLYTPNEMGGHSLMAISGTRTGGNEIAIDGNPGTTSSGGAAFNPPPEMVQEFRIQTSSYDASLGGLPERTSIW
jgi:hypothetical protein